MLGKKYNDDNGNNNDNANNRERTGGGGEIQVEKKWSLKYYTNVLSHPI